MDCHRLVSSTNAGTLKCRANQANRKDRPTYAGRARFEVALSRAEYSV
jgi:hypothetical protein